MTKENYNKATDLLEQIKKLENLKDRLQKDYDYIKDTTFTRVLETLEKCNEVINVLIEIDTNKFKEL